MPPRKPRTDTTLTVAKNADEAMNYLFISFKYWITHYPKWTAIVVFWMLAGLFGLAYAVYDYATTDRVATSIAKPMSESITAEDVQMVLAMHQDKPERVPIIINGQKWGYADPSYVSFVSEDNTRILVYRRGWPAPIWLEGLKLTPPQTKK